MPKILGTSKNRTFRVLWMLEELGVDYLQVAVPPRAPEVTALNASGKVPVYVEDDGTVLTDSTAIITYLADLHGQFTHRAGTTLRGAQDAMTCGILDELEGPLWTAAKHSFILPEERRVPAIKESLKWEFGQSADRLAKRIKGPFVMGDQMTIPDILLAHCTGWSISAKFGPENAVLLDHFKRMGERPAYVRARAL